MIRTGDKKLVGIELLRAACALLNNTREDFNYQFSAHDLLVIAECQLNSIDWDLTPDEWEMKQVYNLLDRGEVPQFEDRNGEVVAVYPKRKRGK